MQYVVIWTPREEGCCSISFPPYAAGQFSFPLTENEALAWSIENQVGKDADGNRLPYSLVPQETYRANSFFADRYFRDAWEWSD
jgi:hypothetical protein